MLRYNRQRQVVAVAAVVVDLVSVAVGGKHRAVEKITECARNRRCRSIVDQCASFNSGTSCVGIPMAKSQLTRPNFGQGTADPANYAAVLDHPGKICAQVVAAYGQIPVSEKNIPSAFDGAGGDTRSVMA